MDKKFNEHKCLQTSDRFWAVATTVCSSVPSAESTSISTYVSKPLITQAALANLGGSQSK